jgi:hypothetical protein
VKPYELIKYLDYTFATKSFEPDSPAPQVTEAALQAACAIRGSDREPALVIHGIMPRSGTVYVGELLRLHPDLHAYPYQLWELPFLQLAGNVVRLQEKFFRIYEQNVGKMGQHDFLPLFGASLIAYLYAAVPPGQRMLVKVPSVQYLNRFPFVFPHEHLLVVVRDGRDLVQSTLRTWPQLNFIQVCRRWDRAARMVLGADRCFSESGPAGYWLARYEDALDDPAAFVREACGRFGLDAARYPYAQIEALPVHGSSALHKTGRVSWRAVERPQNFRPTGYWQEWSAARKWLFKRIAGHALQELGYCRDLSW